MAPTYHLPTIYEIYSQKHDGVRSDYIFSWAESASYDSINYN